MEPCRAETSSPVQSGGWWRAEKDYVARVCVSLGDLRQARGEGARLEITAQRTTEQKLIAGFAKKGSLRGEPAHSSLCRAIRGKNARGAK